MPFCGCLVNNALVLVYLAMFWLIQERSPPVIDDFLYVCDDAYTRNELLEMEKHILKAVDFDIGIPLSYTFLRRYAQVSTSGSAEYILSSKCNVLL